MLPISRRSFLALTAVVIVTGCSSTGSTSRTSAAEAPGDFPPDASGTTSSAPATTTSTASTTTVTSTTAAPPTTPAPGDPPAPEYEGTTDPFVLGVASGDPAAGSVVLWTRLVAGPGEALVGERAVAVVWEADDDPTAGGATWITTDESSAHSVHALIGGLDADRPGR